MGALAAWIGSSLAGIGLFIGQLMGRKALMMGVYVTAYIAITATFAAVINGTFNGMISLAPPGGFFRAGLEMTPSGAGNCISALATAHLASVAYGFYLKLMDIKQKA